MQISFPEWLDGQVAYVMLSALVAVLIGIEGRMLKKNDGALPRNTLFHVFSLIDTLWFFVSLTVLYAVDGISIMTSVPVAYAIYTIFGWIYGTRLLRRRGIPDSPEDLVIPPKYIAYSQSFALIFFVLCLVSLTHFSWAGVF
ncbi:hypothetical protein [Psychrobacter aestuarii]|uniref:Uncharacterized protein n=1 Tax=Psychrobacter aestuarii TaxID=556327 RepID=A0ABN0VVX8_9GAMM|nr:hypothetical protein [Psychrobacter aestuarii]